MIHEDSLGDDLTGGDESAVPRQLVEWERSSRRGFLGRSVATASAVVLAGASISQAKQPARPANHASRSGGTASGSSKKHNGAPSLFPGQTAAFFHTIQDDESAHVAFLKGALGSNARAKPTFQNLGAATVQQFIQMAVLFENTGASAYPSAAPFINSPGFLSAGARIGSIEAYHSGWLNTIANLPLTKGDTPFQPTAYPADIVPAITPFIASANSNIPLTYQPFRDPSGANDLLILNFALALEFLEQEFYNINVPKFFP